MIPENHEINIQSITCIAVIINRKPTNQEAVNPGWWEFIGHDGKDCIQTRHADHIALIFLISQGAKNSAAAWIILQLGGTALLLCEVSGDFLRYKARAVLSASIGAVNRSVASGDLSDSGFVRLFAQAYKNCWSTNQCQNDGRAQDKFLPNQEIVTHPLRLSRKDRKRRDENVTPYR
jgi:hypothetical protein